MFFIVGIGPRRKQLDFDQTVVCPRCGRYGHIAVFVEFQCFSLFFIPLFRWGRTYFVRMGCCGASCALDEATGRAVERGEIRALEPSVLRFSNPWADSERTERTRRQTCAHCGFSTEEDFQFCPKCGAPLR